MPRISLANAVIGLNYYNMTKVPRDPASFRRVELCTSGCLPPAIRELLRMASNTGLLTQIYTDAEKTCYYIHPVPKDEPVDYRPLRLCSKALRSHCETCCESAAQVADYGLL